MKQSSPSVNVAGAVENNITRMDIMMCRLKKIKSKK